MQRFQDLKVWQRSHALTLEIYRATSSYPATERYGLVSQLRRAAASVPTNIAEGSRRRGRSDYARFLNIAEGSLAETEYLVLLSGELGYLPNSKQISDEIDQLGKMLYALRTKVETLARSEPSPTPNSQLRTPNS